MNKIVLSKLESMVYMAVATEAVNIGNDEYRWQGNLLEMTQTAIPEVRTAKKCLHSLIFHKKVIRPLVESKLAGAYIDAAENHKVNCNHLYRIHIFDYSIRGEVNKMTEKKRLRRKPDFNPDKYYKTITDGQVEQVFHALSELPTDDEGWITGGIYRPLKDKGIQEHQTRPATMRLVEQGRIERKGAAKWRLVTQPEIITVLTDEELLGKLEKRIKELDSQINEARSAYKALEDAVAARKRIMDILA